MNVKIGFIGAGNIVQAILTGVEKSGAYAPGEMGIFDIAEPVKAQMADRGYAVFDGIDALVAASEVAVVAVTPQVIGSVAGDIKAGLAEDTVLLSLAAGISNSWYEEHLATSCKVVRCMPTLTAQAGLGAFAVTPSKNINGQDYAKVKAFLESCGIIEEIPEHLMSEVVPINGSAPAYFYHMAALVAKEAAAWGFNEQTAIRLFAETMKGSAETLLSSGMSPQELEDKLRLPGGTTLAALDKMDALGFDHCFTEGLKACAERCRELGQL
ncbi:MAG: pyrroline-5-carboxylate reductase dimerization domain-containing protein [Eubacterium sp.]|nr:pyrroline-5-carboxylate reductase dimerization domain-containing protein [Eubacterium sp.]